MTREQVPAGLDTSGLPIDLERVRRDTPGCADIIHLNNAGSSLPPTPVVAATIDYLEREAAFGGYETATERVDAVERFAVAGAAMLGCRAEELAFQQSASQAWWSAFNSIPLTAGDRVLATRSEYIANVFGLLTLADRDVSVELIPDDEHGQTSIDALAEMLDERVALVCATHVPTSGGLVNPVTEIGRLAKAAGAWYLLDACQSAGQMPLDVEEIQCDFLALTGRKFLRAPRGTGLLYARDGRETRTTPIDGRAANWVAPWKYELHPGARRYESFEVNHAAKVGFGVALDYAMDIGLDRIWQRISDLSAHLRSSLREIDGVTVFDRGLVQCGIVTFSVAGWNPTDVIAALARQGVHTSGTSPLNDQFDVGERAPDGLVRASVHYFNTEDELDRFSGLIAGAAAKPGAPLS